MYIFIASSLWKCSFQFREEFSSRRFCSESKPAKCWDFPKGLHIRQELLEFGPVGGAKAISVAAASQRNENRVLENCPGVCCSKRKWLLDLSGSIRDMVTEDKACLNGDFLWPRSFLHKASIPRHQCVGAWVLESEDWSWTLLYCQLSFTVMKYLR